jgi:hypothetical protein
VPEEWIRALVADFGSECRERLRVSDTEASISLPVAKLVEAFGTRWKLGPRLHPEYPLPEARVRPDYAVETSGRITGFLELKAPGHDVTPDGFTRRDREQWELMRRLPNVLYSNGHTWCLYRGGSRPLRMVRLDGDLYRSGRRSRTSEADCAAFRDLLREFLGWQPQRITSVGQLVTSIAPLCQYLREEVLEQLALERRAPEGSRSRRSVPKPFTALAHHWSKVLFTTPLDHTSVLKTVQQRWNLPPLTTRDAAAPGIGTVLTRTTPRTDDPLAGVTAPTSTGTNPAEHEISHLEQVQADLVARELIPRVQGPVTPHPGSVRWTSPASRGVEWR